MEIKDILRDLEQYKPKRKVKYMVLGKKPKKTHLSNVLPIGSVKKTTTSKINRSKLQGRSKKEEKLLDIKSRRLAKLCGMELETKVKGIAAPVRTGYINNLPVAKINNSKVYKASLPTHKELARAKKLQLIDQRVKVARKHREEEAERKIRSFYNKENEVLQLQELKEIIADLSL